MDVLGIINQELVRWEQQRQDAVAKYNQASVAIETLWLLTEKMRQEVEHEQNNQLDGEEAKATAGD